MEYMIKIKTGGKEHEIKMIDFLTNRLSKMTINEKNINFANRIIKEIANDAAGSNYIAQRLSDAGDIEYRDILNAYNYFVIGD